MLLTLPCESTGDDYDFGCGMGFRDIKHRCRMTKHSDARHHLSPRTLIIVEESKNAYLRPVGRMQLLCDGKSVSIGTRNKNSTRERAPVAPFQCEAAPQKS